jgi:bacterioferritin (cytochrome b1)
MEESPELAALYGLDETRSGPEISAVERLMNEFEAHETKEEKTLEEYRKLAAGSKSPVVRFLLQMILSDEEKHRAVTNAMAATLRGSLTWTKPENSIDDVVEVSNANGHLLALTEEFIELEKTGIKEYRKLVNESEGYYHGLFTLLLQSMIRDSEKHVELLEFLQKRLKKE